MLQLTILYGQPQDKAAFDGYYERSHAPLAQRLPGLKGYTVNRPLSLNPQEQLPHYLVADLYFENMQAFQAALQSPEGQAAAGDLQNFATGGATLMAGEVQIFDPVSLT